MDYAVIVALALAVQGAVLVALLQMPRRQMQPLRVVARARNR
ncbi:hypothetical protein [Frigidibacter mobilis]|uniref:Uncharacterized protein n=1 Tax=Frigidibacter mobilis TaxID=1335048 RepID=A0A159Z4E1_9RHOB|nr:hypothetical protein [Frigidibacter mobilis]AMY69130.1 hypothetical protein AKL17_1880 [Frigidibacter mobilis]